jgi:AraC family transcriptional activator of pobA
MTSAFHDTLAHLDEIAFVGSDNSSAEHRNSINPLQLKQKRSFGGYAVGTHIHRQFEQLIICERGAGSILLDDGHHAFQAPAILIVPALTVHALAFDDNSERWVVSVGKNYFKTITTRAPEFSELLSRVRCIEFAAHDREYVELQHVLDKLDWEQGRSARCHEIATEALLIDLLVGVLRRVKDSVPRNIAEQVSDPDLHSGFNKLVDEHYAENWSLQKFAETLGVSVPRLRAVCHSVSGESPIKIINTRILQEAKRCLTHTSLSVADIASQLGFQDASYFSRFFRSRCGQTPTLYKSSKRALRHSSDQSRSPDEPSGSSTFGTHGRVPVPGH